MLIRRIFLSCILLVLFGEVKAQENAFDLSKKNWDDLVVLLSGEKWKAAEKACLKYLKKFPDDNDSLTSPAILRYMYYRCVAAQLGEKTYSKDVAINKVKPLIGKTIITPNFSFNAQRMFNGLKLTEDEKGFYSCASNNSMTIIQAFETYYFSDTSIVENTSDLKDKTFRIFGTINSIEVQGFTMPRFEVVFDQAYIWAIKD